MRGVLESRGKLASKQLSHHKHHPPAHIFREAASYLLVDLCLCFATMKGWWVVWGWDTLINAARRLACVCCVNKWACVCLYDVRLTHHKTAEKECYIGIEKNITWYRVRFGVTLCYTQTAWAQ